MENKSIKRSCLFSTFISYFNVFFSSFFFTWHWPFCYFSSPWSELPSVQQHSCPLLRIWVASFLLHLPPFLAAADPLLLPTAPTTFPPAGHTLPPSKDEVYPGGCGRDSFKFPVCHWPSWWTALETAAQRQGKGQGLVPVWRLVRER